MPSPRLHRREERLSQFGGGSPAGHSCPYRHYRNSFQRDGTAEEQTLEDETQIIMLCPDKKADSFLSAFSFNMVYRKGSPLNGSPCFSSKSSISRFISSRSSSANITGSNSCQCGRGSAVLLYHLKGSGNILDRRALGRMDESPDQREGAVVCLDNDRSQRHDAEDPQRRQ